ncbi:MAG: hypothetical protein ABI431_02550 [Candidatus Tumulicola sp.]
MQRWSLFTAFAAMSWVFGCQSASGATDSLTGWFMRATAYNTQSKTTTMANPEVLPGKPSSMTCRYEDNLPNFNGVWQLLRYDRVHHIAFAAATTDQCSIALFRASTPAVKAPDADLSGYSTRLGVRIGSTYDSVRSIYGGGPRNGASHFVVQYSSTVPGLTATVPRKKVALPQIVTIVVDRQRVSSISIYTNRAGEL